MSKETKISIAKMQHPSIPALEHTHVPLRPTAPYAPQTSNEIAETLVAIATGPRGNDRMTYVKLIDLIDEFLESKKKDILNLPRLLDSFQIELVPETVRVCYFCFYYYCEYIIGARDKLLEHQKQLTGSSTDAPEEMSAARRKKLRRKENDKKKKEEEKEKELAVKETEAKEKKAAGSSEPKETEKKDAEQEKDPVFHPDESMLASTRVAKRGEGMVGFAITAQHTSSASAATDRTVGDKAVTAQKLFSRIAMILCYSQILGLHVSPWLPTKGYLAEQKKLKSRAELQKRAKADQLRQQTEQKKKKSEAGKDTKLEEENKALKQQLELLKDGKLMGELTTLQTLLQSQGKGGSGGSGKGGKGGSYKDAATSGKGKKKDENKGKDSSKGKGKDSKKGGGSGKKGGKRW
jgi:hypothetical protein